MSRAIGSCVYFGLLCLPIVTCPSVIMCTTFVDNGLLQACMSRLNVEDSQSACLFEQELHDCMKNEPTNSSNHPSFVGGKEELVIILGGDDAILLCRVGGDLQDLEVTWMKQDPIQLLSNTRNPRFAVRREGNTTFDLFIASVGLSDEGVYICQINTKNPKSRRVELRVGRPSFLQAINYEENPIDLQVQIPMITVNESQSFYVECVITGFPPPLLQWISLVKDIESAVNMQYVSVNGAIRLAVDNASRDDSGHYVCRASNPYGDVEKRVRLVVQYEPSMIPLPSIIYAGLTSYIKIDCQANASPPAQYRWTKQREDEEKFVTTQRSLVIVKLEESDYGIYMCYATNLLGTAVARLEICGRPMRPTILSTATGPRRHAYDLLWAPNIITSYGTYLNIDEFIVSYRPWNQPKAVISLGNQTQLQWFQEVISFSSDSDTISHIIRDLYANTTYEVVLYGRNSLGNGEGARLIFTTSVLDLSTSVEPNIDSRKAEELVELEIPPETASTSSNLGYSLPSLVFCFMVIFMMTHGECMWLCG